MFQTVYTCIDSFFRRFVGFNPTCSLSVRPDGAKAYKRSNYTRIEHARYSWGFVPAVCTENLLIRTHPHGGGLGRVFVREVEQVYTTDEMRSIAYTFLAAANSIDGRDKKDRRSAPRTREDAI